MYWPRGIIALSLAIMALVDCRAGLAAQEPDSEPQQVVSVPVNAVFPPIALQIRRDLTEAYPLQSAWTIKGWVRPAELPDQPQIVATLVNDAGDRLVEIGIHEREVFARGMGGEVLSANGIALGEWALVTLSNSSDGVSLVVGDGAAGRGTIRIPGTASALVLAPDGGEGGRFTGAVSNFAFWEGNALDSPISAWTFPNDALIAFENGSPSWPLQVRQNLGQEVPQDPTTLPVSRSDENPQTSRLRPIVTPALAPVRSGQWRVGAWRFVAEPETTSAAGAIASPGFDDASWLPATVPGTVLVSYIDNGVYPDPAYGLNNLLIPEHLNRQDYWYRSEFELPAIDDQSRVSIEFRGINYASEIWVNGERLGSTAGAFARGRIALPERYGAGDRVALAVRVSPPPHPGIPHEESLVGGPGLNGGSMTIDGPTFVASEGWDWIPGVRDRNTGIWQDVVLEVTGAIRIGDPHVRTVLPETDNSLAELSIEVPVINEGLAVARVTVGASFDGVVLRKTAEAQPGSTTSVVFTPEEFDELNIANPRLWWPNGYGEPTLHRLELTASINGRTSDSREIRFGIREVTYELSLVDAQEELRRVSIAPSRSAGEQLLDVAHQNIRQVEGGWAVSLAADVDSSDALALAPETTLAPHLLLRVNGVPIAVRGGNWGMDDWLKRVSRERLEPYFRLHREANVNTIRNWVGQNTESAFFELADEYGLLVLNDFWISTQDHNGEPGDTALFLANAADTIGRFRHHASIALWIGRNEGVPPPVLNTRLEELTRQMDGTRAYLPNSRQIHMSGSGPWNYQDPERYFTRIARGFSTEVGTPSFPSLETFSAMMAPEDRWPISDAWAYHDWHQGRAGNVAPFLNAMNTRYGAPEDLADFERMAQMMNFESHRAIFEGMNAGLFTHNSGRLLWMTHPAWPSTAWQIYSHDYDTHASYFGTQAGSEPVHVQVNLPDRRVAVVNSLPDPIGNASVRIRHFDLVGTSLGDHTVLVDAPALAATETEFTIAEELFAEAPVVLTRLELFDENGQLLSENFYWHARNARAHRAMTRMEQAEISVEAARLDASTETETHAVVTNASTVAALMVKLSLLGPDGSRILPAYWSDNYISLLPGESRNVTIRSPAEGPQPTIIGISGWNIVEGRVAVRQGEEGQ